MERKRHLPVRELFWLVPFTCLGLMTLTPWRSWPVFPVPEPNRIVTDTDGTQVALPLPIRAVAVGSDFMELTHAPKFLVSGGGPGSRNVIAAGIMGHIYPQVLSITSLWTWHGGTFESQLAEYIPGETYISDIQDASYWRRFGVPAIEWGGHPKDQDDMIFIQTRLTNAAIGQSQRGEAFIAAYKQAFSDLEQDLRPQTLSYRPRVLSIGSSYGGWGFVDASGIGKEDEQRLGVEDASKGFSALGSYNDVERILAMNPDYIFVTGESPHDFMRDLRWQGLKAVQDKRVYAGPGDLRGTNEFLWGLDFTPLWARWTAEIVHPERLQPKLRDVMKEHYMEAYGYQLSDTEIDTMLRLDENRDSAGYARFTKNPPADLGQEMAQ